MQITLDRAAIGLSLLCAIHCLILPVVAILAPTSISLMLTDEAFHQGLLWGIIPISIFALYMGCAKHKSFRIFFCTISGLLILCLAGYLGHDYLGEIGEKMLTVLGGTIVAFGHVSNYQLCREQECDCSSK